MVQKPNKSKIFKIDFFYFFTLVSIVISISANTGQKSPVLFYEVEDEINPTTITHKKPLILPNKKHIFFDLYFFSTINRELVGNFG